MEKPEQEKRRKEVLAFWDSGAELAEMTVFNPETRLQNEVTHYKTASRQVHLGYSKIRFHQRQGKVYAQRIESVTFSSVMEQKNNDILKGLTSAEIEQVKDFVARLKEKRNAAELNIEKISAKPVAVDYEFTGGGIITFWDVLITENGF